MMFTKMLRDDDNTDEGRARHLERTKQAIKTARTRLMAIAVVGCHDPFIYGGRGDLSAGSRKRRSMIQRCSSGRQRVSRCSDNGGGFGRRQLEARDATTDRSRTAEVELARDAALRLVRPQYNIEIDSELQRVWEFRHNSVAIVYLSPRAGSLKPHRLTIRERGKIVFSLEWQDGNQQQSSYRPGEWGRVMRQCLKAPSGMRV
jgi:hypothetical protein